MNNFRIEKYVKKDNETDFEYLIRLVGIKLENTPDDLEWQDIVDKVGLNCHYDSLRKAMQPSFYGGYAIYKKLKDNILSLDDDFEVKKLELQKERIRYQDQRREWNRVLRNVTREEELYKLIEYSIKNLKPIVLDNTINLTETNNDLLVFLNDIHYGAVINNFWNTYNPEICMDYMNYYLNKIIQIKNRHTSEKCIVFLGGDLIEGMIHNISRIESNEDVISQTMNVSELISSFISNLSRNFKEVKVFSVSGNHSRIFQDKTQALKNERMDLIVYWYLKNRLKELTNVKCIGKILDETISLLNIRGNIFYGVHGDYDDINNVVSKLTNMTGKVPEYVLMAHNHTFNVKDSKIITSGCFSGVNNYCIEKRLQGEPCQTVCVVDKSGIECIYNIKLNVA